MDKAQAINEFWNGFDIPAYDENSVPDNAEMPYLTYNVSTGKLDEFIGLQANLYYRSTSWKDITLKGQEIEKAFQYGNILIGLDNGYLCLRQGQPFAQRLAEENDRAIKRLYINLEAEFLTAF
jgi:hypothetical protein